MNRVKYPLFQWSLTIALLTSLLARFLLRSESPLAETSAGMQSLAAVLLSILPMAGIALGILSRKREELKVGWSVLVIGLNVFEFLLVLLGLYFLSVS